MNHNEFEGTTSCTHSPRMQRNYVQAGAKERSESIAGT